MVQLTIRGVDHELHSLLKEEAEGRETSINRYVLALLQEATGLSAQAQAPTYHDLDALAGTWGEGEGEAFAQALASHRGEREVS